MYDYTRIESNHDQNTPTNAHSGSYVLYIHQSVFLHVVKRTTSVQLTCYQCVLVELTKNCLIALHRPLELNNEDKSLWSDKCNYLDPVLCTNFNTNPFNFIVMQFNIRSILAHQSELRQLLQTMINKNSQTNVLLLCETFLTPRIQYNNQ